MTSEPIVLTRALIKLILSLFCLVISSIFESLLDNSTKNSPIATAESVSNFSANFPKPLKSVSFSSPNELMNSTTLLFLKSKPVKSGLVANSIKDSKNNRIRLVSDSIIEDDCFNELTNSSSVNVLKNLETTSFCDSKISLAFAIFEI